MLPCLVPQNSVKRLVAADVDNEDDDDNDEDDDL